MVDGNTHSFFCPHTFLRDLLRELRKIGNPHYPDPGWHIALAIAEREDFYRHIGAVNAKADPHPVLLVSYIPDPNPRRLILNGSIQVFREPHETSTDEKRRYNRSYNKRHHKVIQAQRRVYLHTHREEVNAKRRIAYRRNRKEIQVQKQAYYQRNCERLKANAKKARDRKRATKPT